MSGREKQEAASTPVADVGADHVDGEHSESVAHPRLFRLEDEWGSRGVLRGWLHRVQQSRWSLGFLQSPIRVWCVADTHAFFCFTDATESTLVDAKPLRNAARILEHFSQTRNHFVIKWRLAGLVDDTFYTTEPLLHQKWVGFLRWALRHESEFAAALMDFVRRAEDLCDAVLAPGGSPAANPTAQATRCRAAVRQIRRCWWLTGHPRALTA
jgi:hypothetical protein